MKSLLRWIRRPFERARQAPLRRELEQQLTNEFGTRIQLIAAQTKGGYDEIYYAEKERERFAVVRVNSLHKKQDDPIGPNDPGIPLGPQDRLDREWNAYEKLNALGLSPRPLWRSDKAIACSWIPWERAARVLINQRDQFWPLLERIIPAIGGMHHADVIHLDLNLGNILVDPHGRGVAIIDFEFGPVDWVSPQQQRAYDYLRIVDNCVKKRRGGNYLLSKPERFVDLLDQSVQAEDRNAEMTFALEKLRLLAEQPELIAALRRVFPKL